MTPHLQGQLTFDNDIMTLLGMHFVLHIGNIVLPISPATSEPTGAPGVTPSHDNCQVNKLVNVAACEDFARAWLEPKINLVGKFSIQKRFTKKCCVWCLTKRKCWWQFHKIHPCFEIPPGTTVLILNCWLEVRWFSLCYGRWRFSSQTFQLPPCRNEVTADRRDEGLTHHSLISEEWTGNKIRWYVIWGTNSKRDATPVANFDPSCFHKYHPG